MKNATLILLIAVLSLTALFVFKASTPPEKDIQVGAQTMQYMSLEERVLRYVVKMERNKDNPAWATTPSVEQVKRAGKPDIALVRNLFVERGIAPTSGDFDTAVAYLRTQGLVSGADLTPTAAGIQLSGQLIADHEAKVKAEQDAAKIVVASTTPI